MYWDRNEKPLSRISGVYVLMNPINQTRKK
jgi:hypothetical protein